MTVSFPIYNDIKLLRSPLAEVVCQVRFDPILRIISEQPARFQETIRKRFPKLEWDQPVSIQMPDPENTAATVTVEMSPRVAKFISQDRHSTVSLTQDFFSLSTDRYTVWEDFAADLQLVSSAASDCYGPLSVVRIGLRYVNNLVPELLELGGIDAVIDTLNPTLVSVLRDTPWTDVKGFASQIEVEDGDRVLAIRYGTSASDEAKSMIIDLDYYQEGQLSIDGLVERCEGFHDIIYRAFRWSIREERFAIFAPAE